jgi:hypothetical protein
MGGQGASLVARSLSLRTREHYAASPIAPDDETLLTWIDEARELIYMATRKRGIAPREFARAHWRHRPRLARRSAFSGRRHDTSPSEHPAIATLLPTVVAAEDGPIVRPRWFDVISDAVVAANHIPRSQLNDILPYKLKPELHHLERSLPAREIRVDKLRAG